MRAGVAQQMQQQQQQQRGRGAAAGSADAGRIHRVHRSINGHLASRD